MGVTEALPYSRALRLTEIAFVDFGDVLRAHERTPVSRADRVTEFRIEGRPRRRR